MLKYRILSNYTINGVEYTTIECYNEKDERVWVKAEPKNNVVSFKTLNILDRPKYVNWSSRNSHFGERGPIMGNQNRYPAYGVGSVTVDQGALTFLKPSNAEAFAFPLDPLDQQRPVSEFLLEGTACSTTAFTIKVNAPTWVAYGLSASGTVAIINI